MLNSTDFRVAPPFRVEFKIPPLSRSGCTIRKGGGRRGGVPSSHSSGTATSSGVRCVERRLFRSLNPEARKPPNKQTQTQQTPKPSHHRGKARQSHKEKEGATAIQNHFSGTYILPGLSELTARLLRANRRGVSGPGPPQRQTGSPLTQWGRATIKTRPMPSGGGRSVGQGVGGAVSWRLSLAAAIEGEGTAGARVSLCVNVCACPCVRARVCGLEGGGSRVRPKSSDSICYSFLSPPHPGGSGRPSLRLFSFISRPLEVL